MPMRVDSYRNKGSHAPSYTEQKFKNQPEHNFQFSYKPFTYKLLFDHIHDNRQVGIHDFFALRGQALIRKKLACLLQVRADLILTGQKVGHISKALSKCMMPKA